MSRQELDANDYRHAATEPAGVPNERRVQDSARDARPLAIGAAAPLSQTAIAAFASGGVGTGLFATVPAVLLLYFCTEILQLPASWATAIVFAPKIWSILWDPLVGAWSDRSSTRIGRRRPFLMVGTIGVALSFIALFSPPKIGHAALGLWVAFAYFMLASLYSIYTVPYNAVPAELGDSSEVRARLVSSRMFVAMLGVLLGAGVVPLVIAANGGGRPGYSIMSFWVAAICAVAMAAPIGMLRGRDPGPGKSLGTDKTWSWSTLWVAVEDKRFVRLALSFLLQLTAVGVVTSATPYLVTKSFGQPESATGTAMLIMFSVTTLTIPAWSWMGRRAGEMRTLKCALVGYAVLGSCLGMAAIWHAPWPVVMLLFGALGVPFAAMEVLPFTLVAHLIHEGNAGGRSAEGSFTGVWMSAEKIGLALGPALNGAVLWLTAGLASDSLAVQMAVAPAALTLTALLFLRQSRGRQDPHLP